MQHLFGCDLYSIPSGLKSDKKVKYLMRIPIFFCRSGSIYDSMNISDEKKAKLFMRLLRMTQLMKISTHREENYYLLHTVG